MRYLYFLLFCLLPAVSQAQIEDELVSRAEDYFKDYPEERLFLHIAKPEVMAGEDLWFRVFHYQPANNQPFPFSKVAYVELISPEGSHIAGARIKMDAAGGNGYISVPATISSGAYLVKAYTRWMQNFDPSAFFTARVNVINTFKPLGLTAPPDSARVSMRFTPEGGDIIAGNLSNIGILFQDGRSRGIRSGGSILNRDSVEVATFTTNAQGLGTTGFQPEAGQSYRAVIRQDSTTIREFPLPAVRPRGITMRAERKSDHYEVHIEEKGTVPGRRYLAILARGEFRSIQTMASGESGIRINLSDLAEGVNQLTLFNNEGEPVAERLIFRRPENTLNVGATPDKSRYGNREKIVLELTSADANAQAVKADVSVSVIPKKQLAGGDQVDFATYLWLGSELDAGLPSDFHLDDLSDSDIEQLLLIYGWRRYDWESFSSQSYTYVPELREPLISGSISGEDPGLVYFGYQDTLSNIAVAQPRDDGSFYMETPNYFGNKEIIIRHTDSVNRNLSILPLFHESYDPLKMPHFFVSEQHAEYLKKQSENLQVENIFYGNSPAKRAYDESFYGKPTVSYNLDDYTRFPVMEEVMREYVYGVYVRKRQGSFRFSVLDESSNTAMNADPMILLDGIPGFTADEILELDPLNIRRIEVYRGSYGTGPVLSGGIVAFYTYKRDMAGVELSENSIKQQYQGLQPYKQFLSPDHSTESRLPDFRTQLYWNPAITIENGQVNVQFFSSDISGEYIVHVQGLGSHGYAGSTTATVVIE